MIKISQSILECCPRAACVHLKGKIKNDIHSQELIDILNHISADPSYFNTDINEIQDTRKMYKSCGKEPSRYRPSAEALRRRIRTGKGLYSISPAVDIINIISIKSGISIGGYDFSTIRGSVEFRIGGEEPFEAVGRGPLNIQYLPCLYDEWGPFGSPTSDSVRTMIKAETDELLMVFFDFGKYASLGDSISMASTLLKKYCNFNPSPEKST